MPILPPTGAGIRDIVNTILNSARIHLNDKLPTLQAVSGKILGTEDAFTQQCFNNAWRKFQENLANLGYTKLKAEVIIEGIPVQENMDPASQQFINWYNFYDGTNYSSTPTLPSDLVHPLKVWERWTGQNMPFPDNPMECYLDGMPTYAKASFNGMWEWRDNSIYLPGSLMSMDLRILYVKYLPDFVNVGMRRWYEVEVPIERCQTPLSLYVAHEFASTRTASNDAEQAAQAGAAKDFEAKADGETKLMYNRDAKRIQRVTVTRQPRSGRNNGMNSWGY